MCLALTYWGDELHPESIAFRSVLGFEFALILGGDSGLLTEV